jgi:hypothetical protein
VTRIGHAAALLAISALAGPVSAQSGVVHEPFPVRLVFTGDINLGTRTLPDGIPPDSGRTLLLEVDSLLDGDLVVGNFEGVLSDSGDSEKCAARATMCYAFATPTDLARQLAKAGFTHVNLANNHANDFGPCWRQHTEDTFRALSITPYGPRGMVSITPVFHDGRMTLVGLVGFSTYPFSYNLLDLEDSRTIVAEVRPLVDVLVVTFHGGAEGRLAVRTGDGPESLGKEKRGDLRPWARAVLDAGADAVVGHGPHVLRGIEFYGGKPIFYSLGNFLTYRGFNLTGPLGLTTALQLELAGDGSFVSARVPSLIQRPGHGPAPDPDRGAQELIKRVTRLDFPATGAVMGDDGSIAPPP